ncbi:protein kinase domain-containing protein [Nocardia kruczakiae]|uniref:protein kinase domain-containing protein n=1 Tax=Nocardia kruczakiae TaxID=261477 RepID=UPI0007A4AF7F|nr:protein kinase [Nocardia kruczakiae]
MVESDPYKTQRDGGVDVVTELHSAGFTDAEEIGRGGFGQVFRCTQPAVDRTVAVKVLSGELDENRARFFREQRAMGRLTGHPNIVDMLEVGVTGTGRPYLVMPYHARGSLDTRIRHDGPLPLPDVLRLGVKIAGALETAHRADILHRDVKPGNILITDYGEPALTDFGIAHITGGFETSTGTITGSPAFTAPEVLSGAAPSRASDVYGLAATLFCALTGHAAFERRSGEQVVAQFLRITRQPVPDLREQGIPGDASSIIEAAMSHEPSDRPTAESLGEQLRQVERSHGFAVDDMALRSEPGTEKPAGTSPLGAAGSGTRSLPLELTSFIDRHSQVTTIKNLLTGSRSVTLTGTGGVGKSRLALRVAHQLRPDFSGGVWLVELADLRDATSVVDVVAATLGLRNSGPEPTLDVIVRYLSTRDLLLLLDNCEHVIDAVTTLTESLLRACPRIRILATSREALSAAGETVFAVPPLTVSAPAGRTARRTARADAVTLFAARAATAVPGFDVTDRNTDTVARICARLDGLPLAIELAAARLRTMSPDQILSRLDDRYALLTRGSRSAPKRQQTLQYCIGWSYDLCTRSEQRLWNQLSAFAGGFELDAAEYVCGPDLGDAELLDAVAALVDKSILIREDTDRTVRFRMLETIQEYGRRRARDEGEYAESNHRQRDWCERLALAAERDWVGPRQLQWVGRLERELPNLRKALELSVSEGAESALRMTAALYPFWTIRGRLTEGRRWLEHALIHTPHIQTVDRARVLYQAVETAAIQTDLPAIADKVSELETLAENITDPLVTALLAHARGYECLASGDLPRASALLTDAIDIYADTGESGLQLDAQISLGWSYTLQNDTDRALPYFRDALTATESADETMRRSWTLWAAGFTLWRRNETDGATSYLQEGIRAARLLEDPLVAAACAEILAWLAAEDRHHRRAAVLMGAADALSSVAGSSAFMFHDLLVYRENSERSSRTVLGSRNFDTARREGAAMDFDTAVSFALGEGSEPAGPTAHSDRQLTKRERQVADLVAQGYTNKSIAARLVISQRTAEGHVEHILTKLGFTSRAQIAAWVAGQPPV